MKRKLVLLLLLLTHIGFAQKFDVDAKRVTIKNNFPSLLKAPEKSVYRINYPQKLSRFSNPKTVKKLFWGVGIRKIKEKNDAPTPDIDITIQTEGLKNFAHTVIDSAFAMDLNTPSGTVRKLIVIYFNYPVSVEITDVNKNKFSILVTKENESIRTELWKNELTNYKNTKGQPLGKGVVYPLSGYDNKEQGYLEYSENLALVPEYLEQKVTERIITNRITNTLNDIYYGTSTNIQIKYFIVDEKKGFDDFNEGAKELATALEAFNENPDNLSAYKANLEKALKIFGKILDEKSERSKKLKLRDAIRENSYICQVLLHNFAEADKEAALIAQEAKSNQFETYTSYNLLNFGRMGIDFIRGIMENRESLKTQIGAK